MTQNYLDNLSINNLILTQHLVVIMAITLSDISKNLSIVIAKAFELKTGDNAKCIKVTRAALAEDTVLGAVYRITFTSQEKTSSFIVKELIRWFKSWGYITQEISKLYKVLQKGSFYSRGEPP